MQASTRYQTPGNANVPSTPLRFNATTPRRRLRIVEDDNETEVLMDAWLLLNCPLEPFEVFRTAFKNHGMTHLQVRLLERLMRLLERRERTVKWSVSGRRFRPLRAAREAYSLVRAVHRTKLAFDEHARPTMPAAPALRRTRSYPRDDPTRSNGGRCQTPVNRRLRY